MSIFPKHLVLLLSLFLAFATQTYAQDSQPVPVPTPVDSVDTGPYAVDLIGSQSEYTQRYLRDIKNEMESYEIPAEDDSINLAKLQQAKDIKSFLSEDMINNLQPRQVETLEANLNDIYKDLNAQRNSLDNQVKLLRGDLQEVSRQKTRWRATLDADYIAELSDASINRIHDNINKLDSALVVISDHVKVLLDRQDQITAAILQLDDVQSDVQEELDRYRTEIYVNNSVPLWKIGELQSDTISIKDNIKASIKAKEMSIRTYQRDSGSLFTFWLTSFIILAVFVLWIRIRYKKQNSVKQTKVTSNMPYPIITALLVSTLLTLEKFNDATSIVLDVLKLALLIPTLVVLPSLWPKMPRKYFIISAVSVVVLVLTDVFNELTIINRVLMFVNSILMILLYYNLLQWLKVHRSSEKYLPLNKFMLQIGFVAVVCSLFFNVIGNTYLMYIFFNGSITAVFGGVLLFSMRKLIGNGVELIVEDELLGKLYIFESHPDLIIRTTKKVVRIITGITWVVLTAKSFVVFDPVYDAIKTAITTKWQLGSMNISLSNILAFVITFVITIYISRFLRFIIEGEVFVRTKTSRGAGGAILMLLKLVMIAVAFILALGAAEIDISNITIVFGALGVGIGFGLQNIFNNLASGIILAFERPVKTGDVVEIHSINIMGEVKEIGIRASIITTFDGAEVIVPNGNLISNEMINWTLSNRSRRQEILVGVAYGTDLNMVSNIISRTINKESRVLPYPLPMVLFVGFGHSSLDFRILFWTTFDDGLLVVSDLGVAIDTALKEAGVNIPFPQRDLHIINPEAAQSDQVQKLKEEYDLEPGKPITIKKPKTDEGKDD